MLITEVWSKQPGKWFCLATLKKAGRLKKEEKEKPKIYWFKRLEFPEVGDKIDELKKAKLNVYFCPHGFTKKRRIKDNAVPPHLLFADLDERNPASCVVQPTWAIMSSPGRFVGLWSTDGEVTEADNRRWTYGIGADKTGWDFGQILRVPGTRNYKYDDAPRVRVIEGSGKQYKLRDLRRHMPADKAVDPASGDKAQQAYGKWESKLKASTRKLILAQTTGGNDRSTTLWRLNKELLEAGVPRNAAFKILRATVWNKFKERRDGDNQLKKELNKSVGEKLSSRPAEIPELLSKSMAEVEMENLDWVWYPYLARNELTILEGDPGVGKSWLIQMVARHLADGEVVPSGKPKKHKPMTVVFFDFENTMGTVMKARLQVNGMKRFENFYQDDSMLNMMDEDHQTAINERLEELKPDLVVFDTLANYLGGTDGKDSISVSQAMASFRGIARRFNCPVVVVRHLNKGNSTEKAIYRGQGSIAFTGTARICISVGYSPDDPDERLFAINKINVAKVPPTRSYRLTDPPSGDVAVFEWGEERPDMNADDIVKVPRSVKDSGDEACRDWLEEYLNDNGEAEPEDVKEAAEKRNFREPDLRRAFKQLGVVSKSKGFGKRKRTIWKLPEE